MGDHFSNNFNYIKVVFNTCAFKTPENVTCATDKKMYDFFIKKKNKLQLFMKDTYIDAENHDSVINGYVNSQTYLSYSPDLVASANVFFR